MSSHYRRLTRVREAGHDDRRYRLDTEYLASELKKGILYKDKKKMYWIDHNEKDCFDIYARGLCIINSDRPRYWRWSPDPDDGVELAAALTITWLRVYGSFSTTVLSANTIYQVSFRVRLDQGTNLKGEQVNLQLVLPNGAKTERWSKLPDSEDEWTNLVVGIFETTSENVGRMEFSLKRLGYARKKGLVIKGVEIKTPDSLKPIPPPIF